MIAEIDLTYLILVAAISFYISYRARRLYNISSHKGLSIFSQAFMFFGLAWCVRALMSALELTSINLTILSQIILWFLFSYTISLSGFYLVYSLVYKHHHKRVLLIHLVVLSIALIGVFYSVHVIFLVQLAIIAYGAFICYQKYKTNRAMQMYFIVLVLMFLGWSFNYFNSVFSGFDYYTKAATVITFVILLYKIEW